MPLLSQEAAPTALANLLLPALNAPCPRQVRQFGPCSWAVPCTFLPIDHSPLRPVVFSSSFMLSNATYITQPPHWVL